MINSNLQSSALPIILIQKKLENFQLKDGLHNVLQAKTYRSINFLSDNTSTDENNVQIIISNQNLSPETNKKSVSINNTINNDSIHIGFQRHLVSSNNFNNQYLSLGTIRHNANIAEPILRDAHVVEFHLASIRCSDLPQEVNSHPTGLYTEEACQLMRYAGESNALKTINIVSHTNGNTHNVRNKTIAAMMWYALEGMKYKVKNLPDDAPQDFTEFIVQVSNSDIVISFFKHIKTGKFWVKNIETDAYHACSYIDYQQAIKGELSHTLTRIFS